MKFEELNNSQVVPLVVILLGLLGEHLVYVDDLNAGDQIDLDSLVMFRVVTVIQIQLIMKWIISFNNPVTEIDIVTNNNQVKIKNSSIDYTKIKYVKKSVNCLLRF